jgi:catechol 2,3-dioxygenase-like lactoylglutathione lyase family enzyme
MLADSDVVAFVPTMDLERARAFYEGTLGLRFVEDVGIAIVLDASGTMLRITSVPELRPAAHTILGWSVHDLTGTVRRLAERGLAFERYQRPAQDMHGIWVAPDGDRVAWFKDPDGNTLSLTEFATGGPEARLEDEEL